MVTASACWSSWHWRSPRGRPSEQSELDSRCRAVSRGADRRHRPWRRRCRAGDARPSRRGHLTCGEQHQWPGWWLSAHIPIVGKNVDIVRTAAREIDQVTDEVLPGIVDVADKVRLETFRPKDGQVDLDAVADAAPAIARADEVLTGANRDIAAFDVDGVISPLRRPMTQLQQRFDTTATAAAAANDATKLIPTMMAADGAKRNYLLLIMNNAEVRSLGGMFGSIAEITARGGKVEMEEQGGIDEVMPLKKPPIELTESEQRVLQSQSPGHPRHGPDPPFSADRRDRRSYRRKAVERALRRRHGGRPRGHELHAQCARPRRRRRRGDHQ